MSQMERKTTTTDSRGTGTETSGRGSTTNEMRRNGQPTHEQIAKRAYEIFLARGGQHGRHEEDWHQAVRELTSRS